jgi:hypothetical protein
MIESGVAMKVVDHPDRTLPPVIDGATPIDCTVVGAAPTTPGEMEGKLWTVQTPAGRVVVHEDQLARRGDGTKTDDEIMAEVRQFAEARAGAIRQGIEGRMGGRFRDRDAAAIDEVVLDVILAAVADGRLTLDDLRAGVQYRAAHCPRCVRHVDDCSAPERHRAAWLEMVAIGPYREDVVL